MTENESLSSAYFRLPIQNAKGLKSGLNSFSCTCYYLLLSVFDHWHFGGALRSPSEWCFACPVIRGLGTKPLLLFLPPESSSREGGGRDHGVEQGTTTAIAPFRIPSVPALSGTTPSGRRIPQSQHLGERVTYVKQSVANRPRESLAAITIS